MRSTLFAATTLVVAATVSAATIATFAGNGTKGFSGDGGPATTAQLADPAGISRGPDGALYICDTANHRIRKIIPDGNIATVAGTGDKGYSGDGGPATAAKLAEPYEVRFDRAGNIFWVERLSHSVRRVDPKTGIITTVAGNGTPGFGGDDGPAIGAQLNQPHSIAFDAKGDLYIADVSNHRIRKVTISTGIITTLIGNGKRAATPDGATVSAATPIAGPRALAFDRAGNLWVALREGNAVLQLDLSHHVVHRIAGTGAKGNSGDGGPAIAATLNGPKGIAVGPDGRVYVADTENHVIRAIDPGQRTIVRIAGTGTRGDASGSDPLSCPLNRPHGIFVDVDGTVFIGDTEAQRVLRLTTTP